jgi:hypothetical protein
MDPNENYTDAIDDDLAQSLEDLHEEHAEWNDQWARSNEDGWFYPDED